MPQTPRVTYAPSEQVWAGFDRFILDLVDAHGARAVCDIGGGANPTLEPQDIAARNLAYTVLDVSEAELAKGPAGYDTVLADITAPSFVPPRTFDLAFSRMLAEHVRDPLGFHRNVHSLLRDGGLAVHFFPTLFGLPFVVNRFVPEDLGQRVQKLLAPRDPLLCVKMPAFYRWCRGPTSAQIERFERLDFEVLEYRGYFGHPWYYARVPGVRSLHAAKTRFLLRHPSPWLTSYALVVLRKKLTRSAS